MNGLLNMIRQNEEVKLQNMQMAQNVGVLPQETQDMNNIAVLANVFYSMLNHIGKTNRDTRVADLSQEVK